VPTDPDEPTTAYFAGLLDELRNPQAEGRAELVNRLVTAAEERARRLTRSIIRGDMRLPNTVETNDVLQDSLAGFAELVAEGLERTPQTPPAMFACLCTIIRRRAVDAVRKELGQKALRSRVEVPSPDNDEFVNQTVLRLTINELVESLPPEDQEFLNLLYIEDWSYSKLAAHSGCTVETVRWRETRLLRTLRNTAEKRIHRNPPQDPPPANDP
jgi:RNA polymerase sigma factor (sigma-70 family)